MRKGLYRPEIDGLRAVSVIGVVLFHLGLGFPGGFVGVDVFFVISGFLITGILLRQLKEEKFSLSDFWARRIRRIMPAALVMVLVTLFLGGLQYTPDRFSSLARSAMSHVLISSNCYFSRDAGYFAEKSDFEPLLHTWSLSVEEQFYLIFPLMMIFIWKRWRGNLIWIFAALAAVSFAWSYLELADDPKDAFFLLPARGWELLAGAILAMTPTLRFARATRETLSSIGLLMVLVPMFLYDRATLFPGPAALPPVLGAVLFILAGGSTLAGKLLSAKTMVGVGLISYSLYLWHWPLVVYAREINVDLSLTWKLSLLVASFVMGFLSWRWIETPFRTGRFLATKPRALRFGLVSALGLFGVALGIKMSDGLPSRFPKEMQLIIEDVHWNGGEYTSSKSIAQAIGSEGDGPVDFVLWGDSHGASAAPAVNASARSYGLKGLAYLNNGTPPVTQLWFADMDAEGAEKMTSMNERVMNEIIEHRPKVVILVGRWVARCEGYNAIEMVGEREDYHFATMVVDSMIPEPEFTQTSSALIRQLTAMNTRLAAHDIQLVLIQQVPESTIGGTASRFYAKTRYPETHDTLPQFTTTPSEHAARQKRTMDTLAKLSARGLKIVDPTDQFFREGKGLKIFAERSYYRDEDHLTRSGSLHYLTPVFNQIMSQHPRAKSQ